MENPWQQVWAGSRFIKLISEEKNVMYILIYTYYTIAVNSSPVSLCYYGYKTMQGEVEPGVNTSNATPSELK